MYFILPPRHIAASKIGFPVLNSGLDASIIKDDASLEEIGDMKPRFLDVHPMKRLDEALLGQL
jgi:hypothetical protein